jgi:hypothetical protein
VEAEGDIIKKTAFENGQDSATPRITRATSPLIPDFLSCVPRAQSSLRCAWDLTATRGS